ncbi:hypothetical protein B0J17DRAFT_642459, partial [Rhizoctonia solani]
MHGTTKALIVAAFALQASANPVGLFGRQASSSSVPITSVLSSLTSVASPTATESAPIPGTTAPSFPFPGANGTYYICSFPSSNSTTNSTEPITSTATASTATASVVLTNDVLTPTGVTTSVSLSATKPVQTTSFSGSFPTPTPTPFTVVGPSTTAVIECIAVPTGIYPQSPIPANESSVAPIPDPTVTLNTPTSSVPTTSAPSSTL